MYINNEDVSKSIWNDTFDYSLARKIKRFVRENITDIIKINGSKVSRVSLIDTHTLEYISEGYNYYLYAVIIKSNIEFKTK